MLDVVAALSPLDVDGVVRDVGERVYGRRVHAPVRGVDHAAIRSLMGQEQCETDRGSHQHDQSMRGKRLQMQVKTPFLADSSNQRQEPDVRATFDDQ